jgi:uncharacterized membrane protein
MSVDRGVMPTYAIASIATGLALLVLDGLWLGVIARSYFGSRLGSLVNDTVNLLPAAAFYVLYTAGIVYFCVRPALADESWRVALMHGAFVGLMVYGAYDLTNLAILRGWPLDVALVDIAWGTAMTALCSAAGYAAARHVF